MTTKNTIESSMFSGTALLAGGETHQGLGDSTEPHSDFDSHSQSKFDPPKGQVDPSGKLYASYYIHYKLKANKKTIAEIIVTNNIHDPPRGFDREMEYWKIHGRTFNSDQFDRIIVQRVEYEISTKPPFTKEDASFWCPLKPQWSIGTNDADKLDESHSGFRTRIEWSAAEERWEGTLAWMKPRVLPYVFSSPKEGHVTLERRETRRAEATQIMSKFTFALQTEHTLCGPTSRS
ncbi:hypothetical protein [Sorangium sp. So ce1099]|uniref:hypothetical protein n=1 Tax=Sorangium sp. So ce1099 TaxID=3133331 RepID=UPI003F5F87F6